MLARPNVPAILLATFLGGAAAIDRAAAQTDPPPSTTAVAEQTRHHALSLVGEPKYGPDFKHFDWVNPDAPKGGTLRAFAEGSFDSLNPFTVKGAPAGDLGLAYDALMA